MFGLPDKPTGTSHPLKVYLRDHFDFATVLQQSRPTKCQKGQVKSREYGEVLTEDEVYERIEKEEEPKRRREKRRHRGVHRAVQLIKQSRGASKRILKMKKKKVIMVR